MRLAVLNHWRGRGRNARTTVHFSNRAGKVDIVHAGGGKLLLLLLLLGCATTASRG